MNELFDLAEEENIEILYAPLPETRSCSVNDDGDMTIGLDSRTMTTAEQNERLSHELGHCMTNSFYDRNVPLFTRSRMEHRAKKWSVHKTVPFEKLLSAFRKGYYEKWEIAEDLDISEYMVDCAVDIYKRDGLLA